MDTLRPGALVRPPLPAPGVGLTLWRSSALVTCLTDRTRALLAEARPRIVCVHAGPQRLLDAVPALATAIRAYVPDVRLWLGEGLDVYCAGVVRGVLTLERALAVVGTTADLAHDVGAECLVDDLETPGEDRGTRDDVFYRTRLAELRARHPALPVGHAVYSTPVHLANYPSGHSDWLWRVACGAEGVDFVLPMAYVAPKQTPGMPRAVAGPGALARELAASDRSFAAATQTGLVRAGLPRGAYLQLHHTPPTQAVTGAGGRTWTLGWCGPRVPDGGRMDDGGELALRRLCAYDRAGWVTAPGAYRALQSSLGVTVDGMPGNRTWAAWVAAGKPVRGA